MPEQRSVLKEYRDLDEKRLTRGLSPEEQARFARLRELVAASAGAPAVKPGFDVNAAAAALRESLLPAGLRNRPPPTPAPAPQADAGSTADELAAADALASAYEEAPPVAGEEGAAAAPQDALFDPAALGGEPPPYAPGAAYPADPNGQPYDPNAAYPAEAAYDASGQPAWDPNQPWDPNAEPQPQTYDPNAAYPADPNAQAYDPDAAYAADPNAQGYDPNAAVPADAAYVAGGQPAWSPDQPWDLNAGPQAGDPAAAYPADPGAPDAGEGAAEPAWEAAPAAEGETWHASAASPEGGSFAPDTGTAAGWDAEPPPPEPAAGADFGEYDAAGVQPPLPDALLAEAPPPEPEYAEAPEAPAPATPPALGEYDETAGFAAEPFEAAAVPEHALALESARPAPELEASWQPDTALDAGFEAESGGSFGAGADAAAPEWAQAPASPPWEDAPALDLGAPLEPAAPELAGHAPDLDFSHPDLSLSEEAAAEPGADASPAGEEATTFAPELAELPPEDPGALLPPLDLSLEAAGPGADAPELAEAGLAPAILPEAQLAAPELEPPEPEAPPVADLSTFPEIADGSEPAELPALADLAEVTEVTDVAELGEAAPAGPPTPSVAEAAAVEPDLSFDVAEELVAAAAEPVSEAPVAAPVSATPAPSAAAPAIAEEEIPTIDGADILEEILEDVPSAPPQSLDFEPLAPTPAPPPRTVSPPSPEAPEPEPVAAAVLAPPAQVPAPAAAAPPVAATAPSAPGCLVPGSHRVVVHTVEGLVRRGLLEAPDLAAASLALASQSGAPPEDVATEKVKAIFFMLAPGETPPAAEGRRVRVTFRDGRQIAGFSPDYREDGIGFFMIPADTKTNTGRIWVFRSAVRQVSVS